MVSVAFTNCSNSSHAIPYMCIWACSPWIQCKHSVRAGEFSTSMSHKFSVLGNTDNKMAAPVVLKCWPAYRNLLQLTWSHPRWHWHIYNVQQQPVCLCSICRETAYMGSEYNHIHSSFSSSLLPLSLIRVSREIHSSACCLLGDLSHYLWIVRVGFLRISLHLVFSVTSSCTCPGCHWIVWLFSPVNQSVIIKTK